MHWIGIDFGTTNSCAALREEGNYFETLDPAGKEPVPSLIAYHQNKYRYGFEAKKAALDSVDRSEIISELKPKLGSAKEMRIGGGDFHIEELTARFLKHLVGRLFDDKVPKSLGAVIATPVEFPSSHRRALKASLLSIGVQRIEFVYEPTAAVYAAIDGKEFPEGPVGVLDWGGGTVDLSIVQCHRNPGKIEDLNVNARRNGLGGRDLDSGILDRTLAGSPKAHDWFNAQDRSIKSRIFSRLENGKIEYLSTGALKTHGEFWIAEVPKELVAAFTLTPEAIDAVLDEFITKIKALAVRTTTTANLSVEDVTHYLFVGGPLQSVLVRNKLAKLWPRAKEITVQHRQRATARGCALLAERGFHLTLAADIAVRQFDDSLHRVLKSGQQFSFDGSEASGYRECKYRVTDLAAPEAILEIGYKPEHGKYQHLDVLTVPVVHKRNNFRNVIPHDVRLRVGLNELLYVTATATGRIQHADSDILRPIDCTAELSRVPLTLVPGTSRAGNE